MRRLSGGICFCEQEKDLPIAPVGHPHFRARHVISVPIAASNGRDGLEVCPGIRLREADASPWFAVRETRQKALFLVVRTEPDQHATKYRVRPDSSHKPHPPTRHFLKNHRKCCVI